MNIFSNIFSYRDYYRLLSITRLILKFY